MKRIGLVLALLTTASVAFAQDNANTKGFSATSGQAVSSGTKIKPYAPQPTQETPVKVEEEGVRGTGLIYEMSEKGLVVISPTAPANLGYPAQTPQVRPTTPTSFASTEQGTNNRIVDGIALVGFEW